ncbi:MAG: hypothetical protein CW338_04970 [Clostridiales bacterium]|nr:hypothetical protein [Clostridiales bacterium]
MSKKAIITIAAILGALFILFAIMFVVRGCDIKDAKSNAEMIENMVTERDEAKAVYDQAYANFIVYAAADAPTADAEAAPVAGSLEDITASVDAAAAGATVDAQ